MSQQRPMVRQNTRKRKLTPEEKRRIKRKRFIRKIKQNLKFIIPAIVVVLAVIIVTSTLSAKKSDKPMANNDVQNISAAVTDIESDPNTIDLTLGSMNSEADESGESSEGETGKEGYEGEGRDPEAAITPEPTVDTSQWEANGPFDYDTAYIRAVKGEITGPDVVPDMSGIDPNKLNRWPEAKEGNLPLIYKAENMTEKQIAITVDDCFQAGNLKSIVQAALDVGGKLTIFPIGKNISKPSIAEVIKWAWQNGMEIENHTYNHVGLYHYNDLRMTQELWYQNCELNEALGVNYTQHFFRPHGGDERDDQRDHAYISQLGMKAVAVWSFDGSKSSIEANKNALQPGAVYLFHTTDNDWNLLRELIPYAVSQGYQLVTLNEMFGLPENETSELTITKQTPPPAMKAFKIVTPMLKKTTYARASYIVQQRLAELGWLTVEPDGIYGKSSYMAVGYFQQAMGISADGYAGPSTQAVLFSDEAKHK